jgi:UDP-GlcNAc:undecaprenyl-phosphate/decaprenyl-phosphate GlcNAc-1-phosphate transferase
MHKLLLFIIIINILFLLLNNKIARKFNLYDFPDYNRKIHLKKVPLTGGIIFFLNLIFFFVATFYLDNLFFIFNDNFKNFIFIISVSFLFIIGFFDDKYNFSANKRFFLFIVIILINLYLIPELHLKHIKISFLNNFYIGNYSFVWTLICFLLFINAFNFFDGINLQISGLIYSICVFFFYKNIFFEFFVLMFIANTFFIYLNYYSKAFLGNTGAFYLPYLFGAFFITSYNNNINLYADEIVVLILIPGLDLLRLFFLRIINKTNPMAADKNHIHHYLIKKFTNIKSVLIIQSLIWIPFFISQYFGYIHFVLLAQIICYFLIIVRYKS